jgi:hypothetical protein
VQPGQSKNVVCVEDDGEGKKGFLWPTSIILKKIIRLMRSPCSLCDSICSPLITFKSLLETSSPKEGAAGEER